ncbi:MAG: MerR family transcriptional regulator [Firmicutes bacterium]|nr:MerR family transcriptional regulator [Bacillota bacterium]
MEYGINELAKLTGMTTRTLRYYDEIDLLKPSRIGENGYRFYDSKDLETLQQIMFYRKRGFELKQIKEILNDPDYDITKALKEHLAALEEQKNNIDSLIENIKMTLLAMEGEYKMSDKERFEVFKQDLIKENETKYGKEAREKYGDDAVDASNAKIMGMSEEKYERFKALEEEVKIKLETAVTSGINPEGETGKEITAIHKEWLMMTWKTYSPEAHKGLAKMYVFDERFKSYYDKKVEGCADFLQKAIEHWA